MRTLGLYWRTVRHLKRRQVFARVLCRFYLPRPDLRQAPHLRLPVAKLIEPIKPQQMMTGPRQFRFLNEENILDPAQQGNGWDDKNFTKLWRYHLHYFADLIAERSDERWDWHADLLTDWLAHNSPGQGTGWEPFPTSLRIVNWIKAAQLGRKLPSEVLQSLAVQARWLSRRIEHHLSGNHLLANAKALCFAGAFFEGDEADAWLSQGQRLLEAELTEQILPDGGHYELSPMYHALVLEDLLDLIALLQAYHLAPTLRRSLAALVDPMRRWLAAMSHADGDVAFFNDAAQEVAPTPTALETYALRLDFAALEPLPSLITHLQHSGYLRLTSDSAVLLIDAAAVGPDHQPGHAHADTLSFELSLNGYRVLVNSGTSEYGDSPERLRQRGTPAHNTLSIGGKNSSEVWSGFRTGRRARVHDLVLKHTGDVGDVSAVHDGFTYLPGQPRHQRQWTLGDAKLAVRDHISGPIVQAEAFYHFAPDLDIALKDGTGIARRDGQPVLRFTVSDGEPRLTASTHHPQFGLTLRSQTLVITCHENRATVAFYPVSTRTPSRL